VEEKEKCKRDYASVFFASICAFSGSLVITWWRTNSKQSERRFGSGHMIKGTETKTGQIKNAGKARCLPNKSQHQHVNGNRTGNLSTGASARTGTDIDADTDPRAAAHIRAQDS
jgi:hypothetical protein